MGSAVQLSSLLLIVCTFIDVAAGFRSGVVLPNDPYIYIGNNLTLTCNLTKYDAVYNSNYLSFSRGKDEIVPSRYVTVESTRSIVLRYPITSPSDAGSYLCKLNRTAGRPEIIGTQYVITEYEPQPVTDINCRVYNWENMTCTWDLGVQFQHPKNIDIKLFWAVNSQHDCLRQTPTSCSWGMSDKLDPFISDSTYKMGVIIEDGRTKPPTRYPQKPIVITVETSTIVEPAPVKNISSEYNSTCIKLAWKHEKPKSIRVFEVDFKQASERHYQTKHVGDSEMLTLCGLHPNTVYDFQVFCKPRLFGGEVKGFRSSPASIAVKTAEDIPSEAPELLPGSYIEKPYQHPSHHLKKVRVYWKLLSQQAANGNITYYSVAYRNLDTDSESETNPVKGQTQDDLTLIDTHTYSIQIRAATSKGLSNKYSEIYIPGKAEKPRIPEHIVEAHNASKKTKVTITWNAVKPRSSAHWKHLISYTVFWCKGSIMENCQDSIQSADVAVTETVFVLSVVNFESYVFGVAVNALSNSGETISSGFKWNSCIYLKNTIPEVSPEKLRTSVYQPDSGLRVEWEKLSCEDTHAYIHNYVVNICSVARRDNCSGAVSSYDVDRDHNSLTVHDLVEGTRYKVWVNARSEAGLGPNSDIIYTVVIDRRLNSGEIGGIVIGALFVIIIFLFGIILCSRRVFRTLKQRYFEPVPIEIPHTSLPPLPPIPMPPRQNTFESDSSDGIYEKIVEGPPSPSSSTESTTGVEAPLISTKLKLSSLKQHLYGHSKKDSGRHSSDSGRDSGRGSMSQSADTLLMRLHPSHLKKHKKNKKSNKSESDSGVIVDGRGQVCTYTSSSQSEKSRAVSNCPSNIYDFNGGVCLGNTVNVSPYSCVDIVDKMDSKSERLMRKLCTCDKADISKCKGSTLSLPPGLCKMSTFMPGSLDNRAQSAENHLDFEHRRLSSMKEAKEFESSDMNSEAGTLDSVDDIEHETSDSCSSREPVSSEYRADSTNTQRMNSYLKFVDSKKMDRVEDVFACSCDCHRNVKVVMRDGYVTEAAMINHTEEDCECFKRNYPDEADPGDSVTQCLMVPNGFGKNGINRDNQALNIPPHVFGSLGTIIDSSRTTEL